MIMLQFITTNILMVSLGVILYVVVRTLPRVDENAPEQKSAFEKWLTSEVPEKIDKALNGFLVKFLKKTKIFLMKADNTVTAQLKKVKPEGIAAPKQNGSIDFRAIKEENEESRN